VRIASCAQDEEDSLANKAFARKLAALFWRAMTKGLAFVEYGLNAYKSKFKKASDSGLQKLQNRKALQSSRCLQLLCLPHENQSLRWWFMGRHAFGIVAISIALANSLIVSNCSNTLA
jgi:hypothetical protein